MLQMSHTPSIALFGGTFDPIHLGHIHIAQLAQESLQLEKVIFLPCRKSPHKLDVKTASDQHRLSMCKLATEDLDWAEVHDHDLTTPAPSYSWKTVEFFKRQYPEAKLHWLMGTDQWNALDRWNRHEHLASMVDFIVCTRGCDALAPLPYNKKVITSEHPASASAIREAYAENSPPQWLDKKVAEYISEHRIY